MIKVAIIGAGGVGWTRQLVRDILIVPELRDTIFSLTDIDKKRLEINAEAIRRLISRHGLKAKVFATTNRREALRDADYIINAVRIGGLEAWRLDVEIPLKYGVDQCIGDTLGPGGIMCGQRTVPVVLEFCRDIREVSRTDALFLNYVNPMSIITWAAIKYGGVNTIGLCHGVQHTTQLIAKVLKADPEDLDVIAAGVNHMTWFIEVKHKGEDVTHRLPEAFENCRDVPELADEKVRIDLLRRTGYFCTESSGFCSELTPWYRKRPDALQEWINLDTINHHAGESLGGWRFNMELQEYFRHAAEEVIEGPDLPLEPEFRSLEHASYIIEARETGRVYKGHFNVENNHCISNLPPDAIVEIPCYVDRNGVHPVQVGELPPVCAAICNSMISVQRMAMEAAVTGNVTLLKQAMMMDPLTSAVCTTPEIWCMVDEMLVAQAEYLPQYREAIPQAKKNIEKCRSLGQHTLWPPTRKKPRSFKELTRDPQDKFLQVLQKILRGEITRER